MVRCVIGGISDATSSFLEAACSDLQRQIARTGTVEEVRIEQEAGETALVATIRINAHTVEVRGAGENLVTAYGDLRRTVPESILAAAFRQYVERL